jgi:hypothetical protein
MADSPAIKRKIGPMIGVAVFAAIALLQMKQCVLTIWAPPQKITRYVVEGGDRRTLEVYFFPNRQAVFWHTDPAQNFTEGSLVHLRGSVGTHYFGRLWHVDGPGVKFGYRLYPTGCEPVMMEIDTLSHYQVGVGEPGFPRSKQRTYSLLRFCEDHLGFQAMELRVAPADVAVAEQRLRAFAPTQASPR